MIPKEKCQKEIVKVDINNIEVRYFITLKDGEKINLPEYTESYGANRIEEQKTKINEELSKLTTEKVETDQIEKVAKLEAELSEVNEVESKLEVTDATVKS